MDIATSQKVFHFFAEEMMQMAWPYKCCNNLITLMTDLLEDYGVDAVVASNIYESNDIVNNFSTDYFYHYNQIRSVCKLSFGIIINAYEWRSSLRSKLYNRQPVTTEDRPILITDGVIFLTKDGTNYSIDFFEKGYSVYAKFQNNGCGRVQEKHFLGRYKFEASFIDMFLSIDKNISQDNEALRRLKTNEDIPRLLANNQSRLPSEIMKRIYDSTPSGRIQSYIHSLSARCVKLEGLIGDYQGLSPTDCLGINPNSTPSELPDLEKLTAFISKDHVEKIKLILQFILSYFLKSLFTIYVERIRGHTDTKQLDVYVFTSKKFIPSEDTSTVPFKGEEYRNYHNTELCQNYKLGLLLAINPFTTFAKKGKTFMYRNVYYDRIGGQQSMYRDFFNKSIIVPPLLEILCYV